MWAAGFHSPLRPASEKMEHSFPNRCQLHLPLARMGRGSHSSLRVKGYTRRGLNFCLATFFPPYQKYSDVLGAVDNTELGVGREPREHFKFLLETGLLFFIRFTRLYVIQRAEVFFQGGEVDLDLLFGSCVCSFAWQNEDSSFDWSIWTSNCWAPYPYP